MSERISFRTSKKKKDIIERDVKEKGLQSIQQYLEQAVDHFLTCKKTEKRQGMKKTVLKYPEECLMCGCTIKAGEWAVYGRGVGAVCMDCYTLRIKDRTLLNKYLKTQEYKRLLKLLEDKASKLADTVEIYAVGEKHRELSDRLRKTDEMIRSFLTTHIGTDQEKEEFEKLRDHQKQEDQYLHHIEEWLRLKIWHTKLKKKKKKRKIAV